MIYVMNDYELIYLIQSNLDDDALNFMYQKYHRFIWKLIHSLNLEKREHEDFYQEGILMLHKAIKSFDERFNKSFTRYFELIARRHFFKLKQALPKYYLFDHTDFVKDVVYIEESYDEIDLRSSLERMVYEKYFVLKQSVTRIQQESIYSAKQIYNAIYRIKDKYKNMV